MRSVGRACVWAFLIAFLSLASEVPAESPRYSSLWGRDGERWRPGSRLPDFSYAGYHRGERPIPKRRAEINVRDLGARGDGRADDTQAFRQAIAKAAGKVVFVPAGRYRITDFLYVRRSGTVLRGAGPDRSVLYFPTPLNEIKPNWGATTTGRRTSNYSWSGGFVWIDGTPSHEELARVIAPAERGDRLLRVSRPDAFRVGDEIRLAQRDTPKNTLARHLYAGDPGRIDNLRGRSHASFVCRVTRVERERGRIHLDRSLRTAVRPEWRPQIYRARSSAEEIGVENLGFEFPNKAYRGHFTELGYNALAMSGVRNCWARDLKIHNADSGIFVGGVNVTVASILITSERQVERSRRATGHHGVTLGGQDNLLASFEFRTRFMHDLTVTSGSAGNVARAGRGPDLALDHHCHAPQSNLFTDLDLGEGSRMFQSGGGAHLGRHSGAHETFWCIRARRPQSWPQGWGPDLMILVGVQSDRPSIKDPNGKWFEAISPRDLKPKDLYLAQLARRQRQDRRAPTGADE